MPTVYFLPGLLGSTLSADQAGRSPIWVDYTQLVLGQTGKLRLAADGSSPGPPDGIQLYPQGPLPDYYAAAISMLQTQLAGTGFFVQSYGYDFRFTLLSLGAALAAEIVASDSADFPAVLIGHSYGGLVARAAWSSLVASGHSSYVRRVITLGTPHQGSYAAVALWSGDNANIQQLAALAAVGSYIVSSVIPAVITYLWTPDQLEAIAATWPSIYSVLPSLGGTAAAADPQRSTLYTAGNWSGISLSQAWLDYAQQTVSPFLLSASSMPPPWVLTTVAGTGIPTPDVLLNPSLLGSPAAYGTTALGDGVVSTLSALIPTSWQYTQQTRHQDLPLQATISGLLAAEVQAVRNPPDPIPPTEHFSGAIFPQVYGPPINSPTFGAGLGMPGDC